MSEEMEVNLPALAPDEAWARRLDGGAWGRSATQTPGESNR